MPSLERIVRVLALLAALPATPLCAVPAPVASVLASAAPAPVSAEVQGAAGLDPDEAARLYGLGHYEEALASLGGEPAAPDAQRVYLLRGVTLRRLGREGDAAEMLERALKLQPGDLDAAMNLALAFQASGRYRDAKRVFTDAARSHPARPEPLLGLGLLAADQGAWDEAAKQDQLALGLAPDMPAALLAFADAQLSLGRLRKAVDAREAALAKTPDRDVSFLQAAGWYGLGDWDRAAKALDQSQAGDKPEAYFLAGCVAYRRGDLDSAERAFAAALQARPSYPQARLNLGITYYAEERYPEALAQFDAIQDGDPVAEQARRYRSETVDASVDRSLRLGSQAVLKGDALEALRQWQEAEALAPDPGEARRLIRSLREAQGPRADALAAKAEAALAAGSLAEAVQLWNDALRLKPDHAASLAGLRKVGGDLAGLTRVYRDSARRWADADDYDEALRWAGRLRGIDAAAGAALEADIQAKTGARLRLLVQASAESLKRGKPDEALAGVELALSMDPLDSRALALRNDARAARRQELGVLLTRVQEAEAAGDLKSAYADAQKAQALDPGDLEARQEAARLAQRLHLRQADTRQANDLYYQGVYAYGAGDTEKALGIWRRGLRLDPDYGPLNEAVRSAETKLKTLASLRGS